MNKVMLTVVAALALGACAGPRMITGILPTSDRVRFVHGDGIIECQTPKSGEAKQCRDLNIQYQ